MACITTLLERIIRSVVRVTLNLMKYLKSWGKSRRRKKEAPKVPTFVPSLIHGKRSPT